MAQKRTYYMWSGNVRNLPFPERVKATAQAGFDILTLSPFDWLDAMRSGLSTRDMKTMAADAGIRLDHLDPIARWAPGLPPAGVCSYGPTRANFAAGPGLGFFPRRKGSLTPAIGRPGF